MLRLGSAPACASDQGHGRGPGVPLGMGLQPPSLLRGSFPLQDPEGISVAFLRVTGELAIHSCPAPDLEDPTGAPHGLQICITHSAPMSSSSGREGELTAEVGGHGVLLGETHAGDLGPCVGSGTAWASREATSWPQVTADTQPCRLRCSEEPSS